MEAWKEAARKAGQQIMGKTLAELVGRNRLLIERHRGILSYSPEEILVGTDYGVLRIEGTGLQVGCMSREQLFLSGTVRRMTAEGGED